MRFELRPAVDDDRAFLFALKQATMREYVVAAIGVWDEATDRRHFPADLAHIAVVSVDGRDGAMVEVRAEPSRLYLANIQVDPRLQGRGIGGAIITLLGSVAHRRGLPLELRVLKVNGRALQFYERIGLRVTGELPQHWAMTLPVHAPMAWGKRNRWWGS